MKTSVKNKIKEDNFLQTITFHDNKSYLDSIHILLKHRMILLSYIDEINTLQVLGKIPTNCWNYLHASGAIISSSSKFTRTLCKESSEIDEHTDPKKIQWDVIRSTNNYSTHKKASGNHSHCVGIIDSGIDLNHKDLEKNIISVRNFVPKDIKDKKSEVNPTYMKDYLDHGTQVAGQICANGEITSIAPNTGIRIYRVFGEKTGYNIWIISAIIQAANDGVDVINLSLGSYLINTEYRKNGLLKNNNSEIIAFNKAINYAYEKGCIVVGSLGNDGLNIDDQASLYFGLQKSGEFSEIEKNAVIYDFPCQMSKVIGVGSANYFDNIASYSNKSVKSLDILSYAGDYSLLDKHGQKTWLREKYITKDWILSTSSKTVYTYTTGNSLATGKVSSALAAMNAYYNIEKQPQISIELFKRKSSTILNMSDLIF